MILRPAGRAVRPRQGDDVGLPGRPRTKKAVVVFRGRNKATGRIEGVPKLIDDRRRARPPDRRRQEHRLAMAAVRRAGHGTTDQGQGRGSAGWGDDIVAIGTFLEAAAQRLYNFYVVDPSEQQILAYSPARDGSGFPVEPPQQRLTVARDMSQGRPTCTSTATSSSPTAAGSSGSSAARARAGRSSRRQRRFAPGGDVLLRAAPRYTLITSATDKRTGVLYAWDPPNGRVVAFDKAKGTYVEQYRLAGGNAGAGPTSAACTSSRASAPTTRRPSSGRRRTPSCPAILEAAPDASPSGPGASGSPGPSPSGPAGRPRRRRRASEGLAPAVIPLRDANPTRRTAGRDDRADRAVHRRLPRRAGRPARARATPALGRLFRVYGLVPSLLVDQLGGDQADRSTAPSRPSSRSMFLHGDILHIGFNLLFLWIFGNNIEDRLGHAPVPRLLPRRRDHRGGRPGGRSTRPRRSRSSGRPGRSPRSSARISSCTRGRASCRSSTSGFFFQLIQVPAVVLLGIWFVIQIAGAVMASGGSASAGGVALFAHIGGFVAGVLVGLLIRGVGARGRPRPLRPIDRIGVG